MKRLIVLLPLLLGGCLEKPQCYQMYPETKDSRAVLLNECTGETWILMTIPLYNSSMTQIAATFKWLPVGTEEYEPRIASDN